MTVFERILQRNGLERHNNQPLWKYGCTEEEFKALKGSVHDSLVNSRFRSRCVDFSLYVAEWWKREYHGGTPAWDMILSSVSSDLQSYIKEFKIASKEGMDVLDINCIKLNNNHYLRTLFVQGGLPLQRLSVGIGNYSDFLVSLLRKMKNYGEEQVTVDWLERSSLINRLSKVFRNSVIYELSIQTVKAILEDNLDALPFDATANEYVRSLVSLLQDSKKALKESAAGMRFGWQLDLSQEDACVMYNLQFDEILSEEFCIRQGINGSNVKISIDETDVALYRLSGDRRLKLFRSEKGTIRWKGQNAPCCTIRSDEGPPREWYPPGCFGIDQNRPFLVLENVEGSNHNIILSNVTHHKMVWVAVPDGWSYSEGQIDGAIKKFKLFGTSYSLFKVIGEIHVETEEDEITFRIGGDLSEDYVSFSSTSPDWVYRSALPVLTGIPEFRCFDEDGVSGIVQKNCIRWKYKYNNEWFTLAEIMPQPGIIVFKIAVKEASYQLKALYLGRGIKVSVDPVNSSEGSIIITGYNGLVTARSDNGNIENVNTKRGENIEILARLSNSAVSPGRLFLNFEFESGKGKGIVEIVAPFSGVHLTDPNGNLVLRNSSLCVDSLHGYRLHCIGDGYKIRISYNQMSKVVALDNSIYPLYNFRSHIDSLLNLQNPFSSTSCVDFEILDINGASISKIKFSKYNCYVEDPFSVPFQIIDDKQQIIGADLNLKGIFLEITDGEIQEINLVKAADEGYTFPTDAAPGGWIVHSNISEGYRFRPSLKLNRLELLETAHNELSALSRISDKEERMSSIATLLKDKEYSDNVWKYVVSYYKLLDQYELPAAVFDICQVIARDPILAVRFFFASVLRYSSVHVHSKDLKRMEDSLSFAWHTIPLSVWKSEMEHVSINMNDILFPEITKRVQSFIAGLFHEEVKESLTSLIFRSICTPNCMVPDPGPVSRDWLNDLRMSLTTRENWPGWTPTIEPKWRYLLPVEGIERYQWGMILAPVKAALIITGQNEGYYDTIERKFSLLNYYRSIDQRYYDRVFYHTIERILSGAQ